MSTKSTIAWSDAPEHTFHFYHEGLDDAGVYLELEGAEIEYEAARNRVMVRIPMEIWEVIRHRAPAATRFADWSDEQIDAYVRKDVAERVAKYQKAIEENPQTAGLAAFCGSLAFGLANEPEEVQIERGLTYYREVRDEQSERKRRIEAIKARSPRDDEFP